MSDGPLEARPQGYLPRIIYHGTDLREVARALSTRGSYGPAEVLISPYEALRQAVERYQEENSWPGVLIIDQKKLRSDQQPQRVNGRWEIPELDPRTFAAITQSSGVRRPEDMEAMVEAIDGYWLGFVRNQGRARLAAHNQRLLAKL